MPDSIDDRLSAAEKIVVRVAALAFLVIAILEILIEKLHHLFG